MLFIRAGPNTAVLPSQPSHPNEDYRGNAELVKNAESEQESGGGVVGDNWQCVCVFICGCVTLYFIVSWRGNGPYILMRGDAVMALMMYWIYSLN